MKILMYCQYVLGIGHFFRSLEIARALEGHEVVLVTGGPAVEAALPAHVRPARLPGLAMDDEFSRLYAVEPGRSVEEVKQARVEMLFRLFQEEAPDLFLVELYPFGRGSFRFELEPVLEAARTGGLPACRVVSSLRDILVEKKDPGAHEERVLRALNRSFDALLVHADPSLVRLEETFSRTADIAMPVVYTGFVTARPEPGAGERLRGRLGLGPSDRLVVASAGGGGVGGRLLEATLAAFDLLPDEPAAHLHLFTGPFMDEASYAALAARDGGRVKVARFTPDFLDVLAAADLSVSLAGYNTSMNVLAAGAPALLWPFAQNREQRLRAEALAGRGVATVLEDADLEPKRLAGLMAERLERPERVTTSIDLDGAAHTARWLEAFMESAA
jgi:predicted glycosyltransferase